MSTVAIRAAGYIGRWFEDAVLARIGRLSLLLSRTARTVVARSVRLGDIVYQIQAVGVRSLGARRSPWRIFAGMVLAFQFGYGLERFGAKLYIGQTTVTALVRELGPILTALVVGGRIGAGIAAELGGMAVTEQLDAVRALGADPLQRLVAPRSSPSRSRCRCSPSSPTLVGSVGGMLVAWLQYGVSPRPVRAAASTSFVTIGDFTSGLVQGAGLRLHRRRHLDVGGHARHAAAPKASAAPPRARWCRARSACSAPTSSSPS